MAKVVTTSIIAKLIQAHKEQNEFMFNAYAKFIKEAYEEQGEKRRAKIIDYAIKGIYGIYHEPIITLDNMEEIKENNGGVQSKGKSLVKDSVFIITECDKKIYLGVPRALLLDPLCFCYEDGKRIEERTIAYAVTQNKHHKMYIYCYDSTGTGSGITKNLFMRDSTGRKRYDNIFETWGSDEDVVDVNFNTARAYKAYKCCDKVLGKATLNSENIVNIQWYDKPCEWTLVA